jgi:Tfp pilus assembly protein PilX
MKRKHVVILTTFGVAVVLFLLAALAIGGFSWYARVQEDNKRRAEAEAAQKAAADAAAARLATVELNIEQASRRLEQSKAGQKSNAE